MVDFVSMFANLERMGLDTLLVFLLVFTIVYAVMVTVALQNFSEDDKNKKFALIVALVAAFGTVIPHVMGRYPSGYDPVKIIMGSLPNVALISVAIIGLFIILGMFGIHLNLGKSGAFLMPIVILLCVGAIVYIFGSQIGWFTNFPYLNWLLDKDTQALVIVTLVFSLLVWFITKEPKSDDDKAYEKEKGSGFFRLLQSINEGLGNKKD